MHILPEIKRKTITYGISSPADYRADAIEFSGSSSSFSLYHKERFCGRVTLNVPGRFNVYNALATIAVVREFDMNYPDIFEGLKRFVGVHRRLEIKGKVGGITVVDDYGHHPTEIRETLAAAKHAWNSRIIVVFQPHRYTRTKALFEDFLKVFPDADTLIVTDIYAASEDLIEGVNAPTLCEGIQRSGHNDVTYLSDFDDITDHLMAIAKPTDVIITQGAGNVWKIGEEFLKRSGYEPA